MSFLFGVTWTLTNLSTGRPQHLLEAPTAAGPGWDDLPLLG